MVIRYTISFCQISHDGRAGICGTPGCKRPIHNGQDESNDINTDWQDLFYQTGIVTDHNISLSGGSETGSYNFGLGYYNNQGVIPTQQYKRYSLRGSLDQQVGKYFRVGFHYI